MSIAIGRRDIDIRYDPLNGALVPEEILGADGVGNGEFHQNLAIDGLPGRFGFSPNEMPQRRTDLADSGIIVYEVDSSNNLTGFSALGDPLVQVRPPIGGQPGVGEYAVDFNNPINYLNTGRFFFNPSDVNKYYRIHRYFGLGSINSVRNTSFIEQSALALKLSVDGSNAMTANLNLGGFKGTNAADATASGELVRWDQSQIWKGSVSVNITGSSFSTQTITDDAYIYHIDFNSGTTIAIANIIGVPSEEGREILIYAINNRPSPAFIQVHGENIGGEILPGDTLSIRVMRGKDGW